MFPGQFAFEAILTWDLRIFLFWERQATLQVLRTQKMQTRAAACAGGTGESIKEELRRIDEQINQVKHSVTETERQKRAWASLKETANE